MLTVTNFDCIRHCPEKPARLLTVFLFQAHASVTQSMPAQTFLGTLRQLRAIAHVFQALPSVAAGGVAATPDYRSALVTFETSLGSCSSTPHATSVSIIVKNQRKQCRC